MYLLKDSYSSEDEKVSIPPSAPLITLLGCNENPSILPMDPTFLPFKVPPVASTESIKTGTS